MKQRGDLNAKSPRSTDLREKIMKIILKSMALAGVFGLSACSSVPMFTMQEPTTFPSVAHSPLKDLQRYDISQVRKLDVGLHKDQVRHLLGNPHFREGIFSPKVWNYAIGLQQSGTNQYQNCQLRIDFDKHNRVQQLSWKDQSCADLVNAPT